MEKSTIAYIKYRSSHWGCSIEKSVLKKVFLEFFLNFGKFLRTFFSQNTSGRLLLKVPSSRPNFS